MFVCSLYATRAATRFGATVAVKDDCVASVMQCGLVYECPGPSFKEDRRDETNVERDFLRLA